jgi:hypothetical protein
MVRCGVTHLGIAPLLGFLPPWDSPVSPCRKLPEGCLKHPLMVFQPTSGLA